MSLDQIKSGYVRSLTICATVFVTALWGLSVQADDPIPLAMDPFFTMVDPDDSLEQEAATQAIRRSCQMRLRWLMGRRGQAWPTSSIDRQWSTRRMDRAGRLLQGTLEQVSRELGQAVGALNHSVRPLRRPPSIEALLDRYWISMEENHRYGDPNLPHGPPILSSVGSRASQQREERLAPSLWTEHEGVELRRSYILGRDLFLVTDVEGETMADVELTFRGNGYYGNPLIGDSAVLGRSIQRVVNRVYGSWGRTTCQAKLGYRVNFRGLRGMLQWSHAADSTENSALLFICLRDGHPERPFVHFVYERMRSPHNISQLDQDGNPTRRPRSRVLRAVMQFPEIEMSGPMGGLRAQLESAIPIASTTVGVQEARAFPAFLTGHFAERPGASASLLTSPLGIFSRMTRRRIIDRIFPSCRGVGDLEEIL